MLFPSSRNSGPCDRGSGDALTALGFSSVTRLLYRERQHREGQGRRDLESGRKSERKRKKKAAAGKKPAAAPIRQTSLRSSGLRTQDSGAQDLINLIGICVSYKWYAGDLGSFPTQAGKIASVQVIQSELARAGHELLQALRQSGHVAIDPHRPIRNLTQVFIILPQMQVVIENLRPRLPVLGRMLGEVSVVHPLTYGAANHSSGQRRPSHAYHLHIGSAHSEGLEHMILKRQGTGDSHWGHILQHSHTAILNILLNLYGAVSTSPLPVELHPPPHLRSFHHATVLDLRTDIHANHVLSDGQHDS